MLKSATSGEGGEICSHLNAAIYDRGGVPPLGLSVWQLFLALNVNDFGHADLIFKSIGKNDVIMKSYFIICNLSLSDGDLCYQPN